MRKQSAWKRQQGDLAELNKSGEEEDLQLITLHPAQQPPAWSRTPGTWQSQSQGSRCWEAVPGGAPPLANTSSSGAPGAAAKALCVCPG